MGHPPHPQLLSMKECSGKEVQKIKVAQKTYSMCLKDYLKAKNKQLRNVNFSKQREELAFLYVQPLFQEMSCTRKNCKAFFVRMALSSGLTKDFFL